MKYYHEQDPKRRIINIYVSCDGFEIRNEYYEDYEEN